MRICAEYSRVSVAPVFSSFQTEPGAEVTKAESFLSAPVSELATVVAKQSVRSGPAAVRRSVKRVEVTWKGAARQREVGRGVG